MPHTVALIPGSARSPQGAAVFQKLGRQKTAIDEAIKFLETSRNADAGWPYLSKSDSAPEPTCYAALALYSCGKPDGTEVRTISWIAAHAEGASGLSETQWTKSLSLLALGRLQARQEIRSRLVQLLLTADVKQISSPSSMNELNGALRGWSWFDGTFSWVEPTSYALLALKTNGSRNHPRIQEAERLLLDRVCEDGGWNYGNRKVRGTALTSMMPTTALAAMALQSVGGGEPVIQRALDLLNGEVTRRPSTLSLALTVLCLDLYRRPDDHLRDLLIDRQDPDGSWRGQAHLTSLAILALRTKDQPNVFAI